MSGPNYKVIIVFLLVFSLSTTGYWVKRGIEAPERAAWKEYELEHGAIYHINGLNLTMNTSVPDFPKTGNVYGIKGFKLTEISARQRIEEEFPGCLTADFKVRGSNDTKFDFSKTDPICGTEIDFYVTSRGGVFLQDDSCSIRRNLTKTTETALYPIAVQYMQAHGVDTKQMVLTNSVYGGLTEDNSTRFWFYFAQLIEGMYGEGTVVVCVLSNGNLCAYGENLMTITRIAYQANIHNPGMAFGQINRYHDLKYGKDYDVVNISLIYYIPYSRSQSSHNEPTLRNAWAFQLCKQGCQCTYNETKGCTIDVTGYFAYDAETLSRVR